MFPKSDAPAQPSLVIPVQGGTVFTTHDQIAQLYCVYQHATVDGVQYIGQCKLVDAYRYPDARHNSLWPTVFKPGEVLQITILATTPNAIEAHNMRYDLIRRLMPNCNVNGHDVSVKGSRAAIRCIETGEIFESSSEAARMLDVSPSQLSNHLAGRKYFSKIKGRTYERVYK